MVSYFTLQYRYPVNPATGHQQFPASDQNTATALITLQLAAGAAFWATVVWGILDAQLLFKREVVVDTRERHDGRRAAAQTEAFDHGRPVAGWRRARGVILMPSLRVNLPGKGPKVYHLYKKITSIGSGEENDIVLPDPLLADAHAHVHFDGRDFNVTSIDKHGDLHVNGKKRKKHRLVHQDDMKIGTTELTFSLYDEPVTDDEAAKTLEALNSYRKLFEFSERLIAQVRSDRAARRADGRGRRDHATPTRAS